MFSIRGKVNNKTKESKQLLATLKVGKNEYPNFCFLLGLWKSQKVTQSNLRRAKITQQSNLPLSNDNESI